MKRPIFFSDLDDTIFQTKRKMDSAPDPKRLASEALNGSHSYMSETQSMMMEWLLNSTRFIPVTARSTEAIKRCKLPFEDYQVCTNGAVILLPDRTPDMGWLEQTREQANTVLGLFKDLQRFIAAQKTPCRYRSWVVEEFGTGFYFCVKSNEGADALDDIEQNLCAIAGDSLVRHRNDNNLSFTPSGISKLRAVEYLSQKLRFDGATPVFGMGDSLTDLPFMATCDMLVIPQNSQIVRGILKSWVV